MAATPWFCRMRPSSASMCPASPRPFMATFAPAAASCSRMPRPMPLVDPVTIATRPLSGLPWTADDSGAGLDESGMFHHHGAFVNLVDQDAAQRVDVAVPRLLV